LAADRFVDRILANITYWRSKVELQTDPSPVGLRAERENIRRAIVYGLAQPETWNQAAELLLALDYFIEQSGEWASWQAQLQVALEQCGDRRPALKVRLLNLSGRCYRRGRDLQAALNTHRQEEALALQHGLDAHLPQTQLSFGTLYWRERDYEQAQKYAEEALNGFLEGGAGERQMGGVYALLGLVAYGRGRYQESIPCHEKALGHFRKTPLIRLQARSLINLALAQEGTGETDAAARTYLEARRLLENTCFELEKTRLELSYGTLLFNTNRLAEAEEAYLRARSPALNQSDNLYFQALAANNLGNVYLQQGRLGEAELILRQSLVLWDRAHAHVQRLNSVGTLARVLAQQGQLAEAVLYHKEAIEGLEAMPDDAWARQLLEDFRTDSDLLSAEAAKQGQAGKRPVQETPAAL